MKSSDLKKAFFKHFDSETMYRNLITGEVLSGEEFSDCFYKNENNYLIFDLKNSDIISKNAIETNKVENFIAQIRNLFSTVQ